MQRSELRTVLGAFQGGYYALTGLWPLVSISSFEAITGPKSDDWLVQTVGLLVFGASVPLLWGAYRSAVTADLCRLGICLSLAFAVVDVWFGVRGTISPVYFLDGVLEALLAAAWITAWPGGGTPASASARPRTT